MANNWTLNERGNIVFPVPDTVKIPWDKSRGDLPLTIEYFNGELKIESSPGAGTKVRVSINMEEYENGN